ncbi:MAG: type I DNA topoisomerase [Bacteroidales bacterium]|nr:type I DNA topoisomerase [Bacteroidales bacterium]
MAKNLVIVESPAKAKTIEKFLGKDYEVKSSYGHVRDLVKNEMSIDIKNGFEPLYQISDDKKKLVAELTKAVSKADTVWLASDEDREGEAIAWHLHETLKLDDKDTKRIVFNEITKPAILHAIENPRGIDMNLVDAQQARRVLDRLVGYEISPILWRKIKPSLSAGRVQSVSVRLIVEREEEIRNFKEQSHYKVVAVFDIPNSKEKLTAELPHKFDTEAEAENFLSDCIEAIFTVYAIEKKPTKRTPAPPFTTSTLQQEASRKLGFSVSRTMQVAQQLYESGLITYMRTDSVNLSSLAINMAKQEITNLYGEKYSKSRQYHTKTKGAQEAHEAIRPTYMQNHTITGDAAQKRLYELIWKRTIASQMSDAELERTVININISTRNEKFVASGEVVLFDGFLKVYTESTDDDTDENNEKLLPPISKGMTLGMAKAEAIQRFTQHPPRYTEASLVKKLEELGIGRPSTYAPTISTIQKREYIVKEDREGSIRQYGLITLYKGLLKKTTKSEKAGYEKNKLFPTDIGIVVNTFLMDNFTNILDYNFTATVEKDFDDIASGKKSWRKTIESFYMPFHKNIEQVSEKSQRSNGERLLGTDPKSGKNVYAKIGRYGAMIQIGESKSEEKPTFASLKKGQSIDSITLDEALGLFALPRVAGQKDGKDLTVSIGRFGPYVRFNGKFYSLAKTDDPYTVTAERCCEIIASKDAKDEQKKLLPRVIGEHDGKEVSANTGRFGPYIIFDGKNFKLPKGTDPMTVTLEEAVSAIDKPVKKK